MPKIPQYTRQVAPQVQVDRTVGITGAEIQRTAQGLGGIVDAFDKAQRLAQYNEGVVKISQGIVEIKDKYKEDTDFYTINDRAKTDIDTLRNQIIKETPNPQVAETLGLEFDRKSTYALSDIKGVANKGIISDVQAKSFEALDERKKDYLRADNEQERAEERSRIEDSFKAMVEGGILTPLEAQKQEEAFFADLEYQQVFADMERVGPVVVLKLLEEGEYDVPYDIKKRLKNMLEGEIIKIKKQAAGDFDKLDKVLYLKRLRQIYSAKGPQITQEVLDADAGYGLNTDKYEELSKSLDSELKKEPNEVDFALKEVYRAIDRLYTNKKGEIEPIDAALMGIRVRNEVLKRKPETGEEVIKIAEEIMHVEEGNKIKEILDSIWKWTTMGMGVVPDKGESKREKAIQELRKRGKVESKENIKKTIEHLGAQEK